VPAADAPPLTQEEVDRKLGEARTARQVWAAMKDAARLGLEDGYEIVREMDKYRRHTGQRPLIRRPGDEDFQ
jgi:hypothetical protein